MHRHADTIAGMFTQCPRCLAIYELDPATLAQAHGMVGCGQCGATFNALVTLAERLPDDNDAALLVHPTDPAAPILMEPVARPATGREGDAPAGQPGEAADQPGGFRPDDANAGTANRAVKSASGQRRMEPFVSAEGITQAVADHDNHGHTETPSFASRRPATTHRSHTGLWIIGCLVLALCLAAQVGWAERRTLVANPATRPWLARACAWLGCRLPAVSDPSRIMLLSRDVRSYPPDDALLISAAIRNQAPFRQPYPVIAVTLSDSNGTPIAMRRFRPSTYITDAQTRDAGLAPGATAAVRFEVKAPTEKATSFQFAFY